METVRLEKGQFEIAGKNEVAFVNSFFILFKTAQYVEAGNSTYQTQSSKFYVNFRRLVDESGKVSIKVIDGRIFICDRMVKFDSEGLVRARSIVDAWRRIGIGGIVFDDNLDNRQIDKFIQVIANIDRAASSNADIGKKFPDCGLNGIKLLGIDEEQSMPLLTEDKRTIMRRAARVTFFRAITVVEDAVMRAANDKSIDISKARRAVHSLIDQIAEDESVLIELTNIRDFDEYTYVHSANVSVYSLTLGLRLGLDRQRLSELGFAALFHDIGKVRLPGDLIRKPDIYDEDDWRQMQRHPLLGAKTILRNMKFDRHSARAALVAFEHHINNDFTGYPVLIRKMPTNLFSKIVAIADTFDAMSSGRVYIKKLIPPDEVLRKMMYQMTVKFDDFLLKMFVNIIGIFPAGTLVLLTTDHLAVVSRNNQANLSRPVVRIIGDKTGPYKKFVETDLSLPENADRLISKIIDPNKYNIDIKSIILSDR